MSFYKRLNLNETASLEEIQKAYKREALRAHPDKTGSTEEFQLLERIKRVLTNKYLRLIYNLHGEGEELDEAIESLLSDAPPGTLRIRLCQENDECDSDSTELEEDIFEVEEIKTVVRVCDMLYFKIKWQGYKEETWEPEENLSGCQEKLSKFWKTNGRVRRSRNSLQLFN